MLSRGLKENIDPKWVKRPLYWRERHNLKLLPQNTSSSIEEQNGCKDKTTWLIQKALSKSFSSLHTAYIEDIQDF